MSHAYRAVGWNRPKLRYDGVLLGSLAVWLTLFVGAGAWLRPSWTFETLVIRGLAAAAFLLLHLVLSIGPACRIDRRFLPLLYNRRHLGVTLFVVALSHGAFALFQFHALGDVAPLVSVLQVPAGPPGAGGVPFQIFGLGALAILFLMASTSHDFWLRALTPPVWKSLHMGVYLAYALVIAHVGFGVLQDEVDWRLAALVAAGAVWIVFLHVFAGWREARPDSDALPRPDDGWVEVCRVDDIPERRARIVCVRGERVAVFRYDGRLSAVSNVCQHQNGPLGEGRIVGGCIVCPWHGYEYLPESGRAPAPFTERVPTFSVRVRDGGVLVHPRPHAPGTFVEPARIDGGTTTGDPRQAPEAPRRLAAHDVQCPSPETNRP